MPVPLRSGERLERTAQIALRVDQEVGADHNRFDGRGPPGPDAVEVGPRPPPRLGVGQLVEAVPNPAQGLPEFVRMRGTRPFLLANIRAGQSVDDHCRVCKATRTHTVMAADADLKAV